MISDARDLVIPDYWRNRRPVAAEPYYKDVATHICDLLCREDLWPLQGFLMECLEFVVDKLRWCSEFPSIMEERPVYRVEVRRLEILVSRLSNMDIGSAKRKRLLEEIKFVINT